MNKEKKYAKFLRNSDKKPKFDSKFGLWNKFKMRIKYWQKYGYRNIMYYILVRFVMHI